jgi:hypothetical protein
MDFNEAVGVDLDGLTDHDEPIGMGPAGRLVAELGHLDASTGTDVPQTRQFAHDRGGQASNDHKSGPLSFQPLDQLVVVKPFVRADNRPPDPGRDLREARREEVERPAGGMRIPWSQLAVPEVLGLPLEAEQGVIRRPDPLDRVVADPSLLLTAIDHQHRGVHVQDQPGRGPRPDGHPAQKAVVQGAHLREGRRGHPQQEAAERGRLGIARQAGERLEYAILPQQLRGFDPFEPEDHGVQQGEQHLAHAVAVVPLDHSHMPGDRVLEANPGQEAMQQVDAAVMRQRRGTEPDRELPGPPRHVSQS